MKPRSGTSPLLLLLLLLVGSSSAEMEPCLDEYAARLGIVALPATASSRYKKNFCQYTSISTTDGPIEIFGGSQLSSLQLYRARSILEFYLQDVECPDSVETCFGANKTAVRSQMARNKAKLDMPNGAHEEPGAGISLQGQELYWAEIPVEGDEWFMTNDWDHRDAGLEEILHLVHDAGIGVDGPNSYPGAMPEYQAKIRAATNLNQPTFLDGNGLWAEGEEEKDWIKELDEENSLSQEYLASVIDTYYGLWGAFPDGGMWGVYKPDNRSQVLELDPSGYAVVEAFFAPYFTYMAMLSPTLEGTFSMTFDGSVPYTHKSQYYLHATLLGSNNANLDGNSQDNCLGPNAGTNELDGLAGMDVVLFRGPCNDYTVECTDDQSDDNTTIKSCTVADQVSGRDGVTVTSNIEVLAFSSGDFDLASQACTDSVSEASQRCWDLVWQPNDASKSSQPSMGDLSELASSKGNRISAPWNSPVLAAALWIAGLHALW